MNTFICENCEKSYSNLGNLNKHKKKGCKGKKPNLTCCGITFPTPSKYQEHLLTKRHILGVTGFEEVFDKLKLYKKMKSKLYLHQKAERNKSSCIGAYSDNLNTMKHYLCEEKATKLKDDIKSMKKDLKSYKLIKCSEEQWGNLSKELVKNLIGVDWYDGVMTQEEIDNGIFKY